MSLLKRSINSGRQSINSQLGNLKNSILGRSKHGHDFPTNPGSKEVYIFPSHLRSEGESKPMVQFTIYFEKGSSPTDIYFPCPKGLNFSDSANYTTISLGAMGSIAGAIQDKGADTLASVMADPGSIGDIIDKVTTRSNAGEALAAAASVGSNIPIVGDIIGDGSRIAFAREAVVNPRENVAFQNVNIRNFNFQFQLVAENEQESADIVQIREAFQRGLYPKEQGILSLAYPPIVEVKFLYKGQESFHIPRIHKCYLTALTSTINGQAPENSWHTDGAPIDASFDLQLQEVKALTRQDIEGLMKPVPQREYKDREIVNKTADAFAGSLSKIKDQIKRGRKAVAEASSNLGTASVED